MTNREPQIVTNWDLIPFDQIIDLYDSVGWKVYSEDPDSLLLALKNSTLVALATIDNPKNDNNGSDVIGLIRTISDRVSINYIQDILVDPQYQRLGIGRRLVQFALSHFASVRTTVLMTDNDPAQLAFYQSLGLKNLSQLKKHKLNAFAKFKDVELE